MTSTRNKTINITDKEGEKYIPKIQTYEKIDRYFDVLDSTICGDMFDICPLLPRGRYGLIIADPPYNLTKTFGGENEFRRMDEKEYEDYTRQWLTVVKPLLAPNGSIYVCCDWESSHIVYGVLREFFPIMNRITWKRNKGRGANKNWKNNMEDIWFAVNNCATYTFNANAVKQRKKVFTSYRDDDGNAKDWVEGENGKYRDTCCSNIWEDITVPFWSMSENTVHPTQKPEKLIAKLILASSNEGDIIFDPFLGSGTTSVVAKKLNRHYVGIERDMKYCVIAEKRLEMADGNKRIQGYRDGVFLSRNEG